jgi:Ni/Fe-hydrogenase subunit HybB-like protein
MTDAFLARLFTPSPIMGWLLMTLPMTITLSGLFGAAERERGNRRLSLWAAALTVWLFLPLTFAQPQAAQISGVVSILGWLGLVGYWARHVWVNRPTPVWVHAAVITHLVAIAVGVVVALVRASGATG